LRFSRADEEACDTAIRHYLGSVGGIAEMDDDLRARLEFEARRKSVGAGYILWLLLGFLGAHRFYLGKTGSGIVQLLMCLSIIGIIPLAFWWIADAFMIPGMARDENLKAIKQLAGNGGPNMRPHRIEQRRSVDPRVEEIREMRRR
jgi:TM2 domain-containing membrane protein YozV